MLPFSTHAPRAKPQPFDSAMFLSATSCPQTQSMGQRVGEQHHRSGEPNVCAVEAVITYRPCAR